GRVMCRLGARSTARYLHSAHTTMVRPDLNPIRFESRQGIIPHAKGEGIGDLAVMVDEPGAHAGGGARQCVRRRLEVPSSRTTPVSIVEEADCAPLKSKPIVLEEPSGPLCPDSEHPTS